MASVTGFVGDSPDGETRVYLAEDPRRYIDTAQHNVTGAQQTDRELVFHLTLSDDAHLTEGRLDEEGFRALFDTAATPQAYSSFYHDSKFWKCQHSKSIC